MTNMECERIEIALCESHFPLLSRFQDLEQRRSNVFFIDSTHEVKNPCSLLRALLHQDKDGYSKLGCNYGDRGYTFVESKVVHGIKSNPKADTGGKRCHQDDECDLALAMIADFAVRKDAILVAGLYLGTLLPLLQSQRAVVRKHVFDIVGGCLLHYHAFCPSDQQALLTLHSFFLRDRDATCRLKALTCLDCSLKEDNVIKGEIYCALTSMVLRRIVDKSKIVRLKALQILQNLFTKSPVLNFLEHIKKDIVIQVSMLLQISADSPHFCKETIEAAGKVLCAPYLKGSSMVETLDGLLSCERSSATFQVILRVLHFHLDSCGQWLQFLGSRSEKLMNTVEGFLIASMNEQETFATSLPNFMMRACLEIQNQALDEVMLLGSLRMIAFLMPLDCSVLPQQQDFCWALVEILTARTQNLSSISQSEKPLQKSVIKWVLKALAAVFKKNKRIFTIDMLEILERNLVNAYNNGIDGCADCIYSLTSPHTLSKMILLAYEEKLQVLVSPMPLKVLHGYLVFIGDLSRSYQFACDSLIRRLREVQKEISVSISCEGNISEFDYLQQEEQKAREEDAISRFICILLDSNSIPGCFVPFLHELASNSILPPLLRTSALQSLGNYMISSTDLAEKYRSSLESLLQDREADIKLSALFLAEKLILAFPNDYLPVIETVLSLLHDEAVRDAAFVVYANLLLEKKFKLDVLLGPICSFLCDDDEKIRSIAIYLLKRLLHDAGKGKHNLLMSLWNHCTSTDSHKQLVRVLVEHVLDATDLQSDELASAMLQILTLGHNSIAFLGSFLHPSLKVIRTLDFYLSSCPPKINLKGDSEACEYVSQFVRNYRAFKAAATPEKELLGRVLEKLQKRSSRKRKGHSSITKPDDNACNSLVEYEKAIENFKRCEITSCSLWDLFRHDI
ncbi:hypothetical protein KP509_39G024500 [Ceratopteris richardii]|uniref:Uncharacterized protein n=1 Tax=Ceratopteris richardii TaxID=49495 RepID=A0A8T2Q022_CERRI|nr:hypothetical protein KP509_39G024500 [Ceratopteris richardii]